MADKNNAKKLSAGIVTIIILAVCLCITTFALIWSSVSVENNLFYTGSVEINLNDGKPVIHENEFMFEPGMTVKKDFFIENNSTWSVYYRLYFENASGGLADVLKISIKDGEKTLYTGTANELKRENVIDADDILQIKEKKTLTVVFYYPEDKSNYPQKLDLTFTMCAEATQTKNNPNKLFN